VALMVVIGQNDWCFCFYEINIMIFVFSLHDNSYLRINSYMNFFSYFFQMILIYIYTQGLDKVTWELRLWAVKHKHKYSMWFSKLEQATHTPQPMWRVPPTSSTNSITPPPLSLGKKWQEIWCSY
jgi:hypothetical protein